MSVKEKTGKEKSGKAEVVETIDVISIEKATVEFCILGTSPLICNRMSEKIKGTLLFPPPKKNAAEKASSLKHKPIDEFRDSPYIIKDSNAHLAVLSTAFKKAMGTAALDLPGTKKAQILRLIYVEGEKIPVYGIPRLFMAVTRSADINKTPDVRTRAILPEWACKLRVTFTKPIMRETTIANLLAAAGITSGVGDWRQEKGSGSYGAFTLVSKDDPDFVRITTTQGKAAQIDAMENPVCYDDDTSELLAWYKAELAKRGFKP